MFKVIPKRPNWSKPCGIVGLVILGVEIWLNVFGAAPNQGVPPSLALLSRNYMG